MIEGKTRSGFTFKVNEAVLNSVEFYDIMADIKDAADREKANPDDTEASLGGVQAKRLYEILLLGKDQRKALIEHCKGEAGFADAETFNAEIQEIVGIVKEKSSAVKNS